LFSGIGGFDLAAEWMGWENVFQVEIDKFCTKVLEKNFPNVKRYGDIKEFDGTQYRGTVDILSGGFPCQPFSVAGKRKGKTDDRYLWPEMLRVIREIKPAFILGENVGGLISMENGKTLDRILTDLGNEGYTTEQFIIPACAIGAWHRRDRIWIIANSNGAGGTRVSANETNRCSRVNGGENAQILQDVSNSNCQGLQGWNSKKLSECKEQRVIRQGNPQNNRSNWQSEPSVGRVANGIPNRVDRIKGLGNAVVPQVVYQIFKAIEQHKINC
jgi:DNA (cytosine-5)-methyltransferase 1